jgi:hypothetical protein
VIIHRQIDLAHVVADVSCLASLDQITPASLHVEPLMFSILIVGESSHPLTFVGMKAENLGACVP